MALILNENCCYLKVLFQIVARAAWRRAAGVAAIIPPFPMSAETIRACVTVSGLAASDGHKIVAMAPRLFSTTH
jgi:hypothetical protein